MVCYSSLVCVTGCMKRLLPILLVCSSFISPAFAEDPEQLIAQLGSSSYQLREAASRELVAMGSEALQALLKHRTHKELEIRRRIEIILRKMNWQSPALREHLEGLVARIRTDRGTKRRLALLQLVQRAEPYLKQAFQPLRSRLSLRFETKVVILEKWEDRTFRVRLTNRGPGGAWLPSSPLLKTSHISEPFEPRHIVIVGPERLGGGGFGGRRGGRRNLARRGRRNKPWDPLAGYRYLSPGESIVLSYRPKILSPHYGEIELQARLQDDQGLLSIDGPEGKALPYQLKRWRGSIQASHKLTIIPSLTRTRTDKTRLVVGLRLPQPKIPRGAPIPIEVTLQNISKKSLRVWNQRSETAGSPLWYVILGQGNRVVCWGLQEEKRPLFWKVKPTRLQALAAGKRTATTFKLRSARLPPGAYRIVVVFGPINSRYLPAEVWTGEATSNVVKFEVTR